MDPSLLDTTWIWHPQWVDYAEGSAGGFVHFRKSFTVQDVPMSPLNVQVTADTKYKLYINNRLIHSGPVKGDEHLWFYDELDIQPCLKLGINHIGIHVLRFYHATHYATSFPRMRIPGLFVRTPDVLERGMLGIQSDGTWETSLDLSRKLRIDQKEDDFLNVYEDVDTDVTSLNWMVVQCLDLPKSHGISPPWILSPRLIPFPKITPATLKAIHNIQSDVPRKTWETAILGSKDQFSAIPIRLPAGSLHHLELEASHHLTALLHFRFQRPKTSGSTLRITYAECYEDTPKFVPYIRCKADRCDSSKALHGPEDRFVFEGQAGASAASSLQYMADPTGEEVFNEEALSFLAKYHAEGNDQDALVQFEYNEIRDALAHERSADRGSWLQNYLELVRTPGNRKRLFILFWCACISQMSGNAFISYYLAPVLSSVGLTSSLEQTLINATQQTLSWFSALYFATLPQKLGRRVLFLASGCAIFTCLVSITTGSAVFANDPTNKAAGGAVVAFLYLFSPAYNLGLNGNLGLYITEILPFSIRMRGQACFQFFATCFSLLSTYAVPIGLEDINWKFYLVFIPWVVIEFTVLYFVYPEIKGPSLEEIAFLFDGPNAHISPIEKLEHGGYIEMDEKV